MLEHDGSKALSGLTATAGFLPYVVLGLFAGAIGDRVHRKRLMLAAYVWQGLAAALVPVIALHGAPSAFLVLAVAALIGFGRMFVDAGVFGAVADIVPPARFIEAQALFGMIWSSGQVIGPFAGGALIAAFGGAATVGIQACCYGVGALVVLSIRRPLAARVGAAAEPMRRAAREGLLILWRIPMLRLLSAVACLFFFCVMGTQGLLVAYYKDELGFDAHLVGATLAASGIVGVGAGVAIGPLSRRFGGARLMAGGLVGSGVSVLGLAAAHGVVSAMAAAATMGFFVAITTSSFIAERQRYAPTHMQSRVGLSGRAMVTFASMMGSFLASGLASVIALRAVYLGVALMALTIAVWAVPAILRTEAGTRLESAEAT